MKTYILLGALALLTTILIGVHSNWIWALTVFLLLVWFYILSELTFKRPTPTAMGLDFVPGDPDNLDQLYQRALKYCNEIIDHYQHARYTTRRYYIVSQLLIAVLSGLTPILVLIDRATTLKETMAETLQVILSWAMIIVPGIAAILATMSTVFNFQQEWVQAKKTAESLEAIREEFMIGASPQYRITAHDPQQKHEQRKRALENFIIKVNELHLQQVNRWASLQKTDEQKDLASVTVEETPNNRSTLQGQRSNVLPESIQTNKRGDSGHSRPSPNFTDDLLSTDNTRIRPDNLDLEPPKPVHPELDKPSVGNEDSEEFLI
ncbi:MAG: DUF4231 domain-containing protein [Acaryochloridaceae cyanobacterium RL_2_7]|nr:DUF4231 domain-containing protein [Acaryochloridaceae cyanobacterium RL_2_7]